MTYKGGLFFSAAVSALALATPAVAQSSDAAEDSPVLVVTGTRGQPRTIIESSTPIDVIGAEQLDKMGGAGTLRDVLTQLVPSFQAQSIGSSSWDSLARPAGLRGLGGAHVMVLVNGKRRHNSALINLASTSVSSGSNPVDLDLIPNGAIRNIEVLRDGAAAQYGSDAIAGVINIVLKEETSGGQLMLTGGQRYEWNGESEGETYTFDLYKGFKLGEDGYLTLTAAGRDQNATIRASPLTGAIYFPVNGQPDPREASIDRMSLYKGGLPRNSSINFVANAGYDFGGVEVYATGTLGYRKAKIGQAYRRANSAQNHTAIYPDGFTPYYTLSENDFQLLYGFRGDMSAWHWDLSSTYGRNFNKHGSFDTINASLGPSSPTEFTTFTTAFKQWTTNFDVTREFDMGLAKPLTLALGVEHRWENFTSVPKDPLAYTNGFYQYPAGYGGLVGQYAQAGAQGAITLYPDDAADLSRNSYAAYADLATNVIDPWFVNIAARFEQYDDSAGDVLSGKFSTRFELMPGVALRGTVSNGFRAPSLSQQGFAQTSTQIFIINGVGQAIDSKTVKTDSAVGRALGARPLTPEKSVNLSAGLTATPFPGATLSIDAYQIKLEDRIALTSFLSGTAVNAILAANGFQPYSVRYFTNAIDTRTRGIDVVATYNTRLGVMGTWRGSIAYNYNRTKITKVAENPDELAGLNLVMFNRQQQGYLTDGSPRTKLILGSDWTLGNFNTNLRLTRYGKVRSIDVTAANDYIYDAKWVTDIDVSYKLTESTTVSVGANNLFDIYPEKNPRPNTFGGSIWAAGSPFGNYGGFYYARLGVKF